MATQQQAPAQSPGGFDLGQVQAKVQAWVKKQPPAVEIAVAGLTSSTQGAVIGYLLGSMTSMDPGAAGKDNPAMATQLKALQAGGPWAQARNLGVLTGVNSALTLAIKKARKGKDDVWGAMGASFGSGMAYSIVSGAPNPLQSAVTTGAAFALFNGLFYQIGQNFKPETTDTEYERGKYMLRSLGYPKYQENLKKCQLTDNTIMLWNNSALKEARIPAGPRLVILHHLDSFRNPSAPAKTCHPAPSHAPSAHQLQTSQAQQQRAQ